MKGIIILFLLAATSGLSAADRKPVVKDGWVFRTVQQDAELKDWITGLQRVNREALEKADAATTALSKLQGEINTLAAHDQAATALAQQETARANEKAAECSKLAGRLDKLGVVLAAVAGLLAWAVVSKFATLPYSIGAGFLVSGAVFTWLRYLL